MERGGGHAFSWDFVAPPKAPTYIKTPPLLAVNYERPFTFARCYTTHIFEFSSSPGAKVTRKDGR